MRLMARSMRPLSIDSRILMRSFNDSESYGYIMPVSTPNLSAASLKPSLKFLNLKEEN